MLLHFSFDGKSDLDLSKAQAVVRTTNFISSSVVCSKTHEGFSLKFATDFVVDIDEFKFGGIDFHEKEDEDIFDYCVITLAKASKITNRVELLFLPLHFKKELKEDSFTVLEFERFLEKRIKNRDKTRHNKLVLLDQWKEFIKKANEKARNRSFDRKHEIA